MNIKNGLTKMYASAIQAHIETRTTLVELQKLVLLLFDVKELQTALVQQLSHKFDTLHISQPHKKNSGTKFNDIETQLGKIYFQSLPIDVILPETVVSKVCGYCDANDLRMMPLISIKFRNLIYNEFCYQVKLLYDD